MSNVYKIQPYGSILYGCFCIEFIDFVLNNKRLTDFTNVFSPKNFKKYDKVILEYFQ